MAADHSDGGICAVTARRGLTGTMLMTAACEAALFAEWDGDVMQHRARGLFAAALTLAAPCIAHAGWPFYADGPKEGTPEFYDQRANDPVGERQKYHHGKAWPPYNRPCGPEQTCVHKFHSNVYWPYPYNIQD